MDLASPSARGLRELLDKSPGYLRRERQTMGAFEIAQRLLGSGVFISIRLDRVAKFDQRSLSGDDRRAASTRASSWSRSVIGSEAREGELSTASVGRAGGGRGMRERSLPRKSHGQRLQIVEGEARLGSARGRSSATAPVRITGRDDARAVKQAR